MQLQVKARFNLSLGESEAEAMRRVLESAR
jgi:hypothetical protein